MHTAKIIYGGFPTMANNYVFHDSLPVAPLKLAALESCMDLAIQVNDGEMISKSFFTERKI